MDTNGCTDRPGERGVNIMILLLKPGSEPAAKWIAEFKRRMPELEVRVWPEAGNLKDIEVALVAYLPFGELAKMPGLRLILSLPAGLDHLLDDPDLPKGVPIARIVHPDGDPMMIEYAVMNVLRHHRNLPVYHQFQHARTWKKLPQSLAKNRAIGIMGMGVNGTSIARALGRFGFKLAGWTRRPKTLEGVENYAGAESLPSFLACSEILIIALPLTKETNGLLNAKTLAYLPQGASIINMARGAILVEQDLLAALDSGQIGSATLDVFNVEPLPSESPIWRHPRVTVTPHIGGYSHAFISAPIAVENIRRQYDGRPLINLVDPQVGY